MGRMGKRVYWALAGLCLAVLPIQSVAQTAKLSKEEPIEIVSDALEVLQTENKAIFTGNVIAVQGKITMKADKMIVFYRDEGKTPETEPAAPSAEEAGAIGKGIYRIESEGNVFFTSPTETAQGDKAIYTVDDDTIDLKGRVLLTRGNNVLKGTTLVYNLKTGRSVLTGQAISQGGTGRVRGLFIPEEKK
jgi:lipopolysaccharide export system protein LptA